MTEDQKQAQRQAILDDCIKPRTHQKVSIMIPVEIVERAKQDARQKGRIYSHYLAELIAKGMEVAK